MDWLLLLLLATPFINAVPVDHEELKAPFLKYVRDKGYYAEEHFVQTDDGYILRIFRVLYPSAELNGKVVLLQHGIADSAEAWVVNDLDKAIGLVLARKGYDVWFGNNRGNKFSRNHTSLNPDHDAKFWEYSFQEFAHYDQPAVFPYIVKVTGVNRISYIGQSQGTSQMFAALADREPNVVNHIDKFIALGPVVHMKHITNLPMKLGAYSRLGHLAPYLGIHELDSFSPTSAYWTGWFCAKLPFFCSIPIWITTDANPEYINYKRWPVLMSHIPAGTSMRSLMHYAQIITSPDGTFKKYDYGKKKNLEIYGTEKPPVYPIEQIEEEVHLVCGTADRIADLKDASRLKGELKNVKQVIFHEGHDSLVLGKKLSLIHI
eukprot:TRINITY_DN6572_c0_g1_i2.p1 TRINITY_DN6572_c0_g1~~TRINITY_DN6572_c0_g1_i2.p1  ORF type:complete len:376 (-),score=63.21 TRINITY_DN6572_c0_g1_i2:61-1188(-)